ncbi:hypothetical protein [Spirosoma fluviale]|uniref:Uncharacterized protein n=1 Tax=Spirosoma fluviale TaxID=1597977 RepID=A0A286GB14_9BACT|nr:hypothetical protein [Spirosoma fluviale]SOD92682.1 hypothetical protein SAMN06269250_4104 [Spirosoma fluviale]
MIIKYAIVVVCSPGRNFVTLLLYTEDIWQYAYRSSYRRRGPVSMAAIGAVDLELGLLFSPSPDSSFRHSDKDEQGLVDLFKENGIRTFKIDLVQIPDKTAETNFRKFHDAVMAGTNHQVIFNMDVFATTMMAQPLASLPAETFRTNTLIQTSRTVQQPLHSGQIVPIGDEPSGKGWTGFQSISTNTDSFLLVFRKDSPIGVQAVRTRLPAGKRIRLQPVAGAGKATEVVTWENGSITLPLSTPNSFGLFKYKVLPQTR